MKLRITILAAGAFAVACSNEPKQPEVAHNLGFDLSALDSSFHPCEDFFHFTSQGWIDQNPIPPTEGRWGNFNKLNEENEKRVRTILESLAEKTDHVKGTDEQLIGDFYASGMDSLLAESEGIVKLRPYMNEIQTDMRNSRELARYAARSEAINFDFPFSITVRPDSKNPSKYILWVGQSGLGLPDRDYYLNTDSISKQIRKDYLAHMEKMFSLAGFGDNAAKFAQKTFDFEKRLAQISMPKEVRRNPDSTYNKMSIAEQKALTPNFEWDVYYNQLNITTDSVVVSQVQYLKDLNRILATTTIAEMRPYLLWKAIHRSAPYLNYAFVNENFEFYGKTFSGSKEMQPRWKRVSRSASGLGEQIGRIYVEEHFSEDSKKHIEKMVEDLRSAYRQRIEGLTWMTPATKERALEKLNSFTYKIGYPDEWKDYRALNISRDSYLGNILSLSRFKTQENLEKLGKPVDKGEWFMGAHIVNAYYNPLFNEIVFPAGILQPPFYDPNGDDAINYGAIGGVIGHEFTHGFDDQGSKYNHKGVLDNWWTDEDRNRFDDLAQRIVEQYSGYEPVSGAFVNGKLTLGENIADLGGLTLAYHAYKISREGKGPAPVIDGFSEDQRVFMGWAQVWQSAASEKYLRNQVTVDPHSPAVYRVNGTMKNIPEFYKAFNCEDPKDITVIW